jgi:hypothetical protein
MYSAYTLSETQRDFLLRAFPPIYPDVIAHHITDTFPVKSVEDFKPGVATIEVCLHLHDPVRRVECLVVRVNGQNWRKDKKAFHITWSIDRSAGAKPVHSNSVVDDFLRNNNYVVKLPMVVESMVLTEKLQLELLK